MGDWLGRVHCYLLEVCHLVTRILSKKGGESKITPVRLRRATTREEQMQEMQDKPRQQEAQPKMREASSLSMKEAGVGVKGTMVEEVKLDMEEEEVGLKVDHMELAGREMKTIQEVGVEPEEEVLAMEVEAVETEAELLGEEEDPNMELIGRTSTMVMVM